MPKFDDMITAMASSLGSDADGSDGSDRRSSAPFAVIGVAAVAIGCCGGLSAITAAVGGMTAGALIGIGGGLLPALVVATGTGLLVRGRRRRSCAVVAERERSGAEEANAAVAERFLGSPTVRVDGVDVEAGAEKRCDFGLKCRLYSTTPGLQGTPPEEWVLRALKASRSEGDGNGNRA
jgi:hypothetical protein